LKQKNLYQHKNKRIFISIKTKESLSALKQKNLYQHKNKRIFISIETKESSSA